MTMTGKLVHEETASDWDERFGLGGWRAAGGNVQSLQFMNAIIAALSPEIREALAALNTFDRKDEHEFAVRRSVIWDYGCAEGDGTALLQGLHPFAEVVGIDWSPAAVERARERWPTCRFRVGDIREPDGWATVIFTSHTLEHMADPAAVAANLLQHCELLVVAVPDIRPDRPDGGHDGAAPVHDWLDRVPGVIHRGTTLTARLDTDHPGPENYVMESSVVYAYHNPG